MTSLSNSDDEIWAVKYPGGIFGKSGTPDILCCCKGRFVAIEVKRHGEDPTPLQNRTAAHITRAGGLWFCVSSLQEAKNHLLPLLK